MAYLLYCIYIIYLLKLVFSASLNRFDRKAVCIELPEMVLSEILGPAFNARYMSIDQPNEEEYKLNSNKRTAGSVPAFYVDENYAEIITNEPAWNVNHVEISQQSAHSEREKRASKQFKQWECESKVNWMDLGLDYFPRYIRSVECTTKSCWYGHYKCKPRSFTVKILKRRRDRCTVAKPGTKLGVVGLPSNLRELWLWEERAINFCCDCAL